MSKKPQRALEKIQTNAKCKVHPFTGLFSFPTPRSPHQAAGSTLCNHEAPTDSTFWVVLQLASTWVGPWDTGKTGHFFPALPRRAVTAPLHQAAALPGPP